MPFSGRVARKLPIAESTDRVLLLSWSTATEPLKRNVLRIDQGGGVVWRAELPGKAASDCFVRLASAGREFLATTYSGWIVRLNADGQVQSVDRDLR